MRPKPHTAHNAHVMALQKVQRDNVKLSLSLFKRVKQLGSGDVGLVDLVQLQVAQMRSAAACGAGTWHTSMMHGLVWATCCSGYGLQ